MSRLRTLNELVETVKIQYQLDHENSRIKEPAQKIVRAVLNFQDFIQKAVAIDQQDTQLASGRSYPWD